MGNVNKGAARFASDFELSTLAHLRQMLQNEKNSNKLTLLRRIWTALVPTDVFFELPSDIWCQIGFKSVDPRDDLNGSGCLALENICYFVENFPFTFIELANKQVFILDFSMESSSVDVMLL